MLPKAMNITIILCTYSRCQSLANTLESFGRFRLAEKKSLSKVQAGANEPQKPAEPKQKDDASHNAEPSSCLSNFAYREQCSPV